MGTSRPHTAAVRRKGWGSGPLRPKLIGLCAVALAAAVVGVGAADSADADASDGGRRVEVIDLTLQNDQYTAHDLGPKGPSLGDLDVYSGTAIKDGRKVGLGGGSCQVVHVNGEEPTTQCVITVELKRGSVTMQSLWTKGTTGALDMAITGGTGAYDNARGTARYWDIATPKEKVRLEILL
ncbi:allene oxide cyclase barrel-like domain-containing protein [Streptomyces sp. G45]|uniref:allene oxide cyclase barrel-like domain-containing protein n=1 Tax=Streptomyces sp. G45 TaxID=3406627 RepID=UPI003C257886